LLRQFEALTIDCRIVSVGGLQGWLSGDTAVGELLAAKPKKNAPPMKKG
jgi:hypothetical protein